MKGSRLRCLHRALRFVSVLGLATFACTATVLAATTLVPVYATLQEGEAVWMYAGMNCSDITTTVTYSAGSAATQPPVAVVPPPPPHPTPFVSTCVINLGSYPVGYHVQAAFSGILVSGRFSATGSGSSNQTVTTLPGTAAMPFSTVVGQPSPGPIMVQHVQH